MRKGGGKSKGSSFERLICKELSLWMSHGTMEDVYWRSAMSGGRSTVAASKGKRLAAQAGDISCINPFGHPLTDQFIIECKAYADLRFAGILTATGTLCNFWKELNLEARKYDKLPMLIARQNQMPTVVCLNRKGLDTLVLKLKCVLTAPKLNMYAVLLSDFLEYAKRPAEKTVLNNKPAGVGE
jgi:hypothetical protein